MGWSPAARGVKGSVEMRSARTALFDSFWGTAKKNARLARLPEGKARYNEKPAHKDTLRQAQYDTLFCSHHLHNLLECLRLADSEFRQYFAVQLNTLLAELINKDRVLAACCTNSCVQADNPQGAEIALLLLAIHVRVLTGLDNRFLRLGKCRAATSLIAFRKLADLLVSAVPDDTSLNAHSSGRMSPRA